MHELQLWHWGNVAMLEFCAACDIAPMCEQCTRADITQAVQHIRDGKASYRAVVAIEWSRSNSLLTSGKE